MLSSRFRSPSALSIHRVCDSLAFLASCLYAGQGHTTPWHRCGWPQILQSINPSESAQRRGRQNSEQSTLLAGQQPPQLPPLAADRQRSYGYYYTMPIPLERQSGAQSAGPEAVKGKQCDGCSARQAPPPKRIQHGCVQKGLVPRDGESECHPWAGRTALCSGMRRCVLITWPQAWLQSRNPAGGENAAPPLSSEGPSLRGPALPEEQSAAQQLLGGSSPATCTGLRLPLLPGMLSPCAPQQEQPCCCNAPPPRAAPRPSAASD